MARPPIRQKSKELLKALSIFKGKRVYLVGPAQNAKVSSGHYKNYDLVARLNMSPYHSEDQRADVYFLNNRAQNNLLRNKASTLSGKVLMVKHYLDVPRVERTYPKSTVLQIYRHHMNCNKRIHGSQHNRRFSYMGTLAMFSLLEFGATVRVGGFDFYMDGWCNKDNYPKGYKFFPMQDSKEETCHSIAKDLSFINSKLLPEYDGRLTFSPKTQKFYESALERYKID
jgi:hypothetical protein